MPLRSLQSTAIRGPGGKASPIFRRLGAVALCGAQLHSSIRSNRGETMAKDYVEDHTHETVYVHAEDATIETPFPVKTSTGHKYKPGLPGALAICRFQVGDDLAAAAILFRL